jgi:hypothetical protein
MLPYSSIGFELSWVSAISVFHCKLRTKQLQKFCHRSSSRSSNQVDARGG